MAATEKFDMIPVRDKAHFEPQTWDGTENCLPGSYERGGYFLRDGEGEKWIVGGSVTRPLATRKETEGKFSIYEIQGSSFHAGRGLVKDLRFEETHHAIYTAEGVVRLVVDGNEARTTAGETAFVPAGTHWRFEVESTYAKIYIFANCGGIGEVLASIGEKYEGVAVPQPGEVAVFDESRLKALEGELKFVVV
jgi:uncharacterized cupin superfamily protein